MGSSQQPVHEGSGPLQVVPPASALLHMPTGQPRSGHSQPAAEHWGAMGSSQQPVHEGAVPVHVSSASMVVVPLSPIDPVPPMVVGFEYEPPQAAMASTKRARSRNLMTVHSATYVPLSKRRFGGSMATFRRSP